jgi:hypothetical protein
MPSAVRVVGRIDLAEQVCATLRGAGQDAQLVTEGPMSVFGAAPPAEGVDVVIATSLFDPMLWRLAKRSCAGRRPMVAVAERPRERFLQRAVGRRHGPDAYVIWPATGAEILAAIRRAEDGVLRRRGWSLADLSRMVAVTGYLVYLAGPLLGGGARAGGALLGGLGLILAAPSAWSPGWTAVGGIAAACGGVLAVAFLLRAG